MPEVNVALVGYAFMGRAHSNAWHQVSRFFSPKLTPRLKVVCGRDRAQRQEGCFAARVDEWATDWREVVGRPDIDIVDVSTPGDTTPRSRSRPRRRGKAILCEKPLANDVREAKAMLKAVRKAGVPNMICHNYRRAPAVMLARELVASGKLGRIYHYRGRTSRTGRWTPSCRSTGASGRRSRGSGSLATSSPTRSTSAASSSAAR